MAIELKLPDLGGEVEEVTITRWLVGEGDTIQEGDIILRGAKAVLESEFPDLAARTNIQLPDEKSRRVGQSIAAASLPAIART